MCNVWRRSVGGFKAQKSVVRRLAELRVVSVVFAVSLPRLFSLMYLMVISWYSFYITINAVLLLEEQATHRL